MSFIADVILPPPRASTSGVTIPLRTIFLKLMKIVSSLATSVYWELSECFDVAHGCDIETSMNRKWSQIAHAPLKAALQTLNPRTFQWNPSSLTFPTFAHMSTMASGEVWFREGTTTPLT